MYEEPRGRGRTTAEEVRRTRVLLAGVGRVGRARYSMAWSAWRMRVCGIVRRSALAVFRLISNSNFVGCSTGRSAGLPL
jgi:hypothetical protein